MLATTKDDAASNSDSETGHDGDLSVSVETAEASSTTSIEGWDNTSHSLGLSVHSVMSLKSDLPGSGQNAVMTTPCTEDEQAASELDISIGGNGAGTVSIDIAGGILLSSELQQSNGNIALP